MIMLDTDIFVDHLRGYPPAVSFFGSLTPEREVLFSAVTEAELISGKDCKNGIKKELLLHFLHRWTKIPVSNQVAELAGDLVRDYSLALPDALIAATALVSKAELLTRNIKDFKDVPHLLVKAPY